MRKSHKVHSIRESNGVNFLLIITSSFSIPLVETRKSILSPEEEIMNISRLCVTHLSRDARLISQRESQAGRCVKEDVTSL